MKKKIAILDTGYDSFSYEADLFEKNGYELTVFPGEKSDLRGKVQFAKDAVGLLIRWTEIDKAFLDQTPLLEAIVRYGTGYENIDLHAVTSKGVRVANVTGYASQSVSDHALALMYACARALPQGQQQVVERFGAPPTQKIMEFHEKTLGIIGLGRIGGTLSQKARHLFKRVLAYDPYISKKQFEEAGALEQNLEQLLAESNVISIHCTLTDETKGMIGEKAFEGMSQIPILINTSRGPVVHDNALITALEKGKIHSAGIDVYNTELAEELPGALLNHPLAITTGHYAWYSERSHHELQIRAAHNMLDILNGIIPEDCLNP